MKELDILSFKLELADLLDKFDVELVLYQDNLLIDVHCLGMGIITAKNLRKK